MSDSSAIIEFAEVSKTYYRTDARLGLKNYLFRLFRGQVPKTRVHQALSDVSFTIRRGECVAIIGRNGAGKSTILGLMAGVIQPTSGSVKVSGKVAPLLELGAGFHPQLTGRENILLNAILLGLTRRQAMAVSDAVVDFAELWECIDEPLHTYSTGMQVRLGFSVAVHIGPEILLVDEVLAVGDEDFQRKCLQKIRQFRDQGVTILVVTHKMEDVTGNCDRAIWIDRGRLVGAGKPQVMVDAYRNGISAPLAPAAESGEIGSAAAQRP